MPEKILDKIIVEPKGRAQHSVIFLHGLGANGDDFIPIIPQLNIQDAYNIRFVFPHAPAIPVTINNHYIMPAWFDVYSFDRNSREDEKGIEATRLQINQLILGEQQKGIPFENICLAGFSQGGVIALYTALKFEHKLAGVIGLSCYLPQFNQDYHQANQDISIFLAHGTKDEVVEYSYGTEVQQRLMGLNYNINLHSYNMGHSVCNAEIEDIRSYLVACFGADK